MPQTAICGMTSALEVIPSLPKSVLPICYQYVTNMLVNMSILPTNLGTNLGTNLVFLGLGGGKNLMKGHFGGD